MDIIYLDRLFVLNATVDYLLLLSTGRICSLPLRRRRIVLSALLGGLYAAACILRPSFFTLWTVKLFSGAAMVLLAYGVYWQVTRAVLVFYAVSAAFGGAITLLSGPGPNGQAYVPVSLPVLALAFAVCYALLSLLFRHTAGHTARVLRPVTIGLGGSRVTLTALEDTGNELIDPASGLPVVIVCCQALWDILPPEACDVQAYLSTDPARALLALSACAALRGRVHLLPCRAISGSSLLVCFRPDELWIDDRPASRVVALTASPLSDDGAYLGLI